MADRLQLGPDLWFPPDAITQTIALLAVKRAGKSNAAAVLAEEMFAAGLPWVAVDPKGDWWGLRSSADGKGPGLPVPIFGGLHGDMPMLPESGRLMAELIVEQNLTCVLDVSRFSKAARMRFLADFAERLFELHQADPHARMVILEEAQAYLPQRVMNDQARCVGAFTTLVAQGGSFGLGITLISQRSAVLNKDVLSEVEVMVALRSTSPQDRKAIRDWMEHHAIATEIVDSLPGLPDGEAWISSSSWLPKHGQPAIQRARFRQRSTFDSGATPVAGERRRPATLADIDLGALETRMAAVVEQASANDPARLRRRIAELERQAAKSGEAGRLMVETARLAENAQLRADLAAALARPPERVEIPVLADGDIPALEQALNRIADALATARAVAVGPAPRPAPPARRMPAPVPPQPGPAVPPAGVADVGVPGTALPRAQRAILTVLAQFPAGRTRTQLGLLSGYSVKSSGYGNSLGALRSAGLISPRGDDPILATEAGLAALGDGWEPLPAGAALLERWMQQLGKAERIILRCLLDVWPGTLTRGELAEASGYSATSSGFGNSLGKLRTLELINRDADIAADETFAREVLAVSR